MSSESNFSSTFSFSPISSSSSSSLSSSVISSSSLSSSSTSPISSGSSSSLSSSSTSPISSGSSSSLSSSPILFTSVSLSSSSLSSSSISQTEEPSKNEMIEIVEKIFDGLEKISIEQKDWKTDKLFFGGDDSGDHNNQTEYEYHGNLMRIAVVANSEKVGNALLFFLRVVYDNIVDLLWDPIWADTEYDSDPKKNIENLMNTCIDYERSWKICDLDDLDIDDITEYNTTPTVFTIPRKIKKYSLQDLRFLVVEKLKCFRLKDSTSSKSKTASPESKTVLSASLESKPKTKKIRLSFEESKLESKRAKPSSEKMISLVKNIFKKLKKIHKPLSLPYSEPSSTSLVIAPNVGAASSSGVVSDFKKRVFFGGSESKSSAYEYDGKLMKIGVVANSEKLANALLFFLRVVYDDNTLILWDSVWRLSDPENEVESMAKICMEYEKSWKVCDLNDPILDNVKMFSLDDLEFLVVRKLRKHNYLYLSS